MAGPFDEPAWTRARDGSFPGRESGVRVLSSVQEKKDPTKFTILEIYADDAAYKHHIGTAHFKKYKEGTIKMVKDLQLIDCNPLVPEALIKPAK